VEGVRGVGHRRPNATCLPGTMLNIAEFSRLTSRMRSAVRRRAGAHARSRQIIAEPILKEINNRLRFLTGVGLEYLSLDRKTATLSGGEAQRIRLAIAGGQWASSARATCSMSRRSACTSATTTA
jgi:excinuclease UvrABC ATPase subunit